MPMSGRLGPVEARGRGVGRCELFAGVCEYELVSLDCTSHATPRAAGVDALRPEPGFSR